MEAAPPGVDVDAIARAIGSVDGVRAVHDLHVWSVTPGFEALAAHVVVARGADRDRARREVEFVLRDRYGIEHTTLQMEEEADDDALLEVQTILDRASPVIGAPCEREKPLAAGITTVNDCSQNSRA